ncbi:hypothetical protein [Aquipuribacter nitratireducens]|uniref:ABC-2 type transport system permease protein n=1 Tax=Aquipuribacter nitratireducens TaxID=650104 RepID=A0ABW0GM46_9MICO
MVGVLLGLRVRLLRNQLRGGTEQVVLLVVGVLFALGTAVVAAGVLAGLRFAPLDLAGAGVVVLGALALVAWAVLPLLLSSDDVMADPVRFALVPVPPRRLAVGLLAGSVVTPFAVATALASLALVITFSRGAVPVAVAVVTAALGTLTCLLAGRAVLTAAASLVSGRRGREATIAVGVLVLSLLGFSGPVLVRVGEQLRTGSLDALVAVLAWSPLGAVWSLPTVAAQARWPVLAGRAAVAVATVVVLWLCYERALEARLRPSGAVRGGRGRDRASDSRPDRLARLLPDSPAGAQLERSLRYWVRDNRYAVSVVALPVVTLLLLALPALTDAPAGVALLTGPFVGLLLAFTMLNEIAFDGGALWLALSAAVRGRDDRAARALAMLVWGAPVTTAVAVASAVAGDRHDLAPALVGASLGVLLVGTAVAAVTSVLYPYPVPPAGSNPFSGTSGSGAAALLQQAVGGLALAPLLAPVGVLLVWAWATPAVGWVLALVGPLYGALLLAVAVRLGGRVYDSRGPELLARLRR